MEERRKVRGKRGNAGGFGWSVRRFDTLSKLKTPLIRSELSLAQFPKIVLNNHSMLAGHEWKVEGRGNGNVARGRVC